MAIMGRKKQMIKHLMDNRKLKEREIANEERKRVEKNHEDITEEEHQRRINMLQEIGLTIK